MEVILQSMILTYQTNKVYQFNLLQFLNSLNLINLKDMRNINRKNLTFKRDFKDYIVSKIMNQEANHPRVLRQELRHKIQQIDILIKSLLKVNCQAIWLLHSVN